jgi:uncharacterized protein YjdB
MASVLLPFCAEIQQSAISAGFQTTLISPTTLDVYSSDLSVLQSWISVHNITSLPIPRQMASRFCSCIDTHDILRPHSTNVPYFTMSEVRSIYQIPNPINTKYVVGVMSFGGGLYGTVDSQGVLTNGDVQSYWTSIGIPSANQPKVIVVPINGATNAPNINDGGSTIENTLDVEAVGGACPSANLTIILYITPNSFNQFAPILNYMYSNIITVNGEQYKPNLISCSWGSPEIYFTNSQLSAINAVLTNMTAAGINICAATGDYGSNNGVGGTGNYVDFPSSNPNITAVGGTNMVCPNNIYDEQTVETAWTSGGGGISAIYPKPSYQLTLSGTNRSTPDIAAIADPNTGVVFMINGQLRVIGGTSVSAPTIAGFLAAINCKTFINPLLYQAPYSACFHDVTRGSNGGYTAGIVYDNCTGLGSINGAALADFIANPPILVSSISLNMTSITMSPTETSQLTNTVLPANATNKVVIWSSSNTSVVTITNGLIAALTTGSSTITVTSTDGSNVSTSITVTVLDVNIPVTGITLDYTTRTLQPNNTLALLTTIVPSNATNQGIIWSSNSTNATVSSSGVVTARYAGIAVITATTLSGSLSASCTITIVIPVTSFMLSPSVLNMNSLTSKSIMVTIFPSNATNKQITWLSSNTAIASITSSGVVTSGSIQGSAIITARSVDSGYTATVSVSVGIGVQSVSLNSQSISLTKGNTFQAIATIQPIDAANKNITWTSALSSVATVSSSGLITAVGNGTGIIMGITQDKNKLAFMVVRVTTPISTVSLNQTVLVTARNMRSTLVATVLPSNASNKSITWTSSNPNVATVSSTGVVYGVSIGNIIITAQAVDGGIRAVCNVIVH